MDPPELASEPASCYARRGRIEPPRVLGWVMLGIAPPPTYPDSITHSLLFNHNYLYMDALATNIITWMWEKFGKHCTNPSLMRLHSPPQNFDSKVIGLLHKLSYYHYLLPMTKPKRVVLPIH
jgi:hypothetical protein